MKKNNTIRGQRLTRLFSTTGLVCISLFLALVADSQWLPNGPPTVLEHQFISTGGITYFRLVALLSDGYCCQRVNGYEVLRQDSDLDQVLEQEIWGGACIDLYCPPWPEEFVSVLGALPPGGYSLTLWAGTSFPSPLPPSPWATYPFTVPVDSGPTLSLSTVTNAIGLELFVQCAGVANVIYVLESCTNLTDWTGIQTNLGAPVTFTVTVTNEPQRFYRAAILQAAHDGAP
jgi:hypothetical protein